MRRHRTVIDLVVILGLSLTGCQAPEPDSNQDAPSATASSSTSPATSPEDWGNILTVGPPTADIPRFTVDGRNQTILDWYSKLRSGQCEGLVHDTSSYDVNSDNRRATYALAFLYRGAAYTCLQKWRSAAIDLEAAAICRDDLASIGNSDKVQPFELLEWAIGYVEQNGERVGGRNPRTLCGSAPTQTVSDVPTTETPTQTVSDVPTTEVPPTPSS